MAFLDAFPQVKPKIMASSPPELRGTQGPLLPEQRAADFVRARGLVRAGDEELDLGRYLTGVVSGRWSSDSDRERRAMAEGVQSSGGVLVPTILSAQLIDLARKATRVIEAGANVTPMPNQVLDIAKWTGDPSNAWRLENSTIPQSDATMSKVTLRAKSLAALTTVSRELVEDAPNVGTALAHAFAESFAIKVDYAALLGTGVDPEPRGVKSTTGVTILTPGGANGASLTSYDPFIDAAGVLADANEAATGGIIVAPRTWRTLGKLKDSQLRYLDPPTALDGLPFLSTNQLPINTTLGTSTDTSDAFVADWRQLIIGVRTDLIITPLNERFADQGQIGFVAWWRGDIAVTRPAAFCVISGLRP